MPLDTSAQHSGIGLGYKQTMRVGLYVSLLCIILSTAWGRGAPQAQLNIRILQGDGGINSIRLHRAHDPVVEVLDDSGRPITGATVTFILPASGPGGAFRASGLSLTLQTDQHGIAAAHGLQPNRLPGQFRIRVAASYRGEAASATILQTNAEPPARSRNKKLVAILALIGGGAAVGAVAAMHGGNSASSAGGATTAGSVTGATIVPGTPSFGPPH